MAFHYSTPCDPECPEFAAYVAVISDDPMGKALGAPLDEILVGFEKKHRTQCIRCRTFGCDHIEVAK